MRQSQSGIANNFLWKLAERFSAQIVSFVVSLILARLLMPDDYGVVALVLVFIEVANVFVSAGLGNALIQKKDADDIDFSSALYFNFGVSIILYLILFFTSPAISFFYKNDILTPVIRIFSIRLILASINSIQQAYVSRQMIFRKFFFATLIGTIISGVIGVWMAFKGYGVWALVVQYLTNTTIDTIILGLTIRWKPKLVYSWKRIGKLLKFGWKILFEGLAGTISAHIRSLIIGKIYTETDLGYYSKAQQFPQLIMSNINTSISSVLFPAMSKVQDDDKKILELTRKSVKVSSYFLFPMLFGIAAVATNLVIVLLTEKWIDCVPYMYIYCFSFVITIGMYSRHEALKAKGRSDVYMIEHILSRVVNLIILLLVFRISVLAVALSGLVGSFVLVIIIMFTSKKYTGYRYRDQITDVFGLLVMSFSMFVPSFLIGYLFDFGPFLELIFQVLLGIFIYSTASIIFKPEGYIYILKVIQRTFFKNKKADTIGSTYSKTSIGVAAIISLIPCCFLRYLPFPISWIVLTQIIVFLFFFILVSLLQKHGLFCFLRIYIYNTIEKYKS